MTNRPAGSGLLTESRGAALFAPAGSAGSGLDRVVAATVASGTYTVDLTQGDTFVITATGNCTLAVAGLQVGRRFVVEVHQDGTGGRTVTLPAAAGAVTPHTTANTFDIYVFYTVDGSTLRVAQMPGGPFAEPFSPLQLADKLLWVRASTVAGDPGDAESAWLDAFGQHNLYQTTAAKQPTLQSVNGDLVYRFDGTDDSLQSSAFTQAQPITYAFLARVVADKTTAQNVLTGLSSACGVYVNPSSGTPANAWAFTAGTAVVSSLANDHGFAVVVAVFNGASSLLRVNGTQVASGNVGTNGQTGFRVMTNGSDSARSGGDVAEIIAVGHAAGSTEITNLEAWLNTTKQGLLS